MTASVDGAPLIEMRGVTKTLTGEAIPVTLVRDINLTVRKGEMIAVTGPSGSGKSSLLYLMGLLDVPTEGEVLVEGKQASRLDEDERAHVRLAALGFVFQFHFLLPEFTARANIMLPMRALGTRSEADMRQRADALLAGFGLAEHGHKLPGQLSGGQRQRVAIARALANEPLVLLADEPTGNLDTQSSEQVLALLRKIVDEMGRAVVMVTHDLDLAARADRRIHIVDGRIAEA